MTTTFLKIFFPILFLAFTSFSSIILLNPSNNSSLHNISTQTNITGQGNSSSGQGNIVNQETTNNTNNSLNSVNNCYVESEKGVCYQCLYRYYLHNGTCLPSNLNCKTYSTSQPNCLSCLLGFSLVNGSCVFNSSVDLLQGCYVIDSNNTCLQCSRNYYFNSNNVCEMIDTLCKVFHYQLLTCIGCFPGYYLNLNQRKCLPNNNQNNIANVFCIHWKGASCLACFSGYVNLNNTCVAVLAVDPYCLQWFSNNTCQTCLLGYFFNQSTNKCSQISRYCDIADQNSGQCYSCYAGYNLLNNQCILSLNLNSTASHQNIYCQLFDGNHTCTQCYYGYYVNSSTNMCLVANSLCKDYTMIDGQCTSCYRSFALVDGMCIVFPLKINDPNCVLYTEFSFCVSCQFGFFLNYLGICQIVNQYCLKKDINGSQCLQCVDGFILTNGACYINHTYNFTNQNYDPNCGLWKDNTNICLECVPRAYFNTNGKCTLVSDLCESYNNSNGECLSCYGGYQLANSKCVVKQQSLSCASFNRAGNCISCYATYYLQDGLCIQIDPTCRAFDYTLLKCYSCYVGYHLTSNSTCQID